MTQKPDVWLKAGLIEVKHYRAMGEALWLYIYIHQQVNFDNGDTARYQHKKAAETFGVTERTVRRWFQVLEDNGYVEARRTRWGLIVKIAKYMSLKERTEMRKNGHRKGEPERTEMSVIEGASDSPERTNPSARTDISVNQERTNLSQLQSYITTRSTTRSTMMRESDSPVSEKLSGKPLSDEIYRYVKTMEETIGYEYTSPQIAHRQAKAAIQANPRIACEELVECAIWMLETNDFWQKQVLQISSVVKQLGLFRKRKQEGWKPGQKGQQYGGGNGARQDPSRYPHGTDYEGIRESPRVADLTRGL